MALHTSTPQHFCVLFRGLRPAVRGTTRLASAAGLRFLGHLAAAGWLDGSEMAGEVQLGACGGLASSNA
jgi:hypothetical protein